jgi:hypothetical protein
MNVTENGEPHYGTRIKPPKSQNVTTEARGRTNVLVCQMNLQQLLT